MLVAVESRLPRVSTSYTRNPDTSHTVPLAGIEISHDVLYMQTPQFLTTNHNLSAHMTSDLKVGDWLLPPLPDCILLMEQSALISRSIRDFEAGTDVQARSLIYNLSQVAQMLAKNGDLRSCFNSGY